MQTLNLSPFWRSNFPVCVWSGYGRRISQRLQKRVPESCDWNFCDRRAREQKCSLIAFGHQLDDILETQLQRIARGCGAEGLAAPRPVARFEQHPIHIRPLLHLRARDLRLALATCGAALARGCI